MAEFHTALQSPNDGNQLLASLEEWTTLNEQTKSSLLDTMLGGQVGTNYWKEIASQQGNIHILLINSLEAEIANLHVASADQSSDDQQSENTVLSKLLKIFFLFTRDGESLETSIIPNICGLLRVTQSGSKLSLLEQCLVKLIDKRGQDFHLMGLTCRLICHITGIAVLPNWDTDKTIEYPDFFSCITGSEKDKHAVKRLGDIAFYFAQYMKEHRILPSVQPPQSSTSSMDENMIHYSWIISSMSNSINFTGWVKDRLLDPSLLVAKSQADYIQKQLKNFTHYGNNSPLMQMELAECIYNYSIVLTEYLIQYGSNNNMATTLQLSDGMVYRLLIHVDFVRLLSQMLSLSLPSSERLDTLIDNVLELYVKWFHFCVFQQQQQTTNGTRMEQHRIKYFTTVKILINNAFFALSFTTNLFQRWIQNFDGIEILFNAMELICKKWKVPSPERGIYDDALTILSILLEVCTKMIYPQPHHPDAFIDQCIHQVLEISKKGKVFLDIIVMLQTKRDGITYSNDRLILGPIEWIIHILNHVCTVVNEDLPSKWNQSVPKLAECMIDILRSGLQYKEHNLLIHTCRLINKFSENSNISKKLLDNNISFVIIELVNTYIDNPMMYPMVAKMYGMIGSIAAMNEDTAVRLGNDGICEIAGRILKKFHPFRKHDDDDVNLIVYRSARFAIANLAEAGDNIDRIEDVMIYMIDDDEDNGPSETVVDNDIATEDILPNDDDEDDEQQG